MLKRIRLIVKGIIKSNCPDYIRLKCVELLIRIGLVGGNPEDLILAAQFQFEFKLDISRHLEFFLDKTEIFETPICQDPNTGFQLKAPM